MTPHVIEVRRLTELPDEGNVVVAHPADERAAMVRAAAGEKTYFLSSIVPPGYIYTMDMAHFLGHPRATWEALPGW